MPSTAEDLSNSPIELEPERSELDRLASENSALRLENEALRLQIARMYNYMRMAYQDPLTGLNNRRYFDKRVAEELCRAQRHSSYLFSILLIDIDDFKQINDEHGHMKGDEVLKWVASFLENNTRLHDICCRMAGDEFVVILPNQDAKRASSLVARIRQALALAQPKLRIPVSLSIGLATYGKDGRSVAALFERADADMYRDKRRQKGICNIEPLDADFHLPGRDLELVRPTRLNLRPVGRTPRLASAGSKRARAAESDEPISA